ncbi:hypothetical protein L3Q82_007178 [Scortum barcoo]|uniref:Uncharacterized protein n=1 Tax=Scortum barcoo TaxID=214431 RepID=A0ACB8WRZ7_9TELE|nr:hypothetical protein L3Q82_007178 [Scortum barcoo]
MRKQRLGNSEVDSSITQAEVTEVVRPARLQAPRWQGAWVDEIRPEYLKSLFLRCKGDQRVCSYYRGITLLSLPGKVSRQGTGEENLADSRPSDSEGTMRFFRPGRGTLDQLYTLRRVLEGLWEFAQPVHMCFVDLEKAFDRVPRGILWGVLREYGVRGPLLRAVRSLYDWTGAGACRHSIQFYKKGKRINGFSRKITKALKDKPLTLSFLGSPC